MGLKVKWDLLAHRDLKANKALRAIKAKLALKALKAYRAYRVNRALPVHLVQLAHEAPRVLWVQMVLESRLLNRQ